ncbi:HpcH/HpaI aldolase/citrate lyase family protein [Paraburkholderia hospita]|uniref:HpcH/HpaI aldolase/citrate lyase family protein n=1 Tax=Paraburkholderia hospita TaxID=169430 RepID=UPI0002719C66|nr:aldolase/citrate lyase family protein [Paraburkholderia hospita]EUC18743.1 HpcH/HpaI aldolase [Burkholderia sp. BT03]SKC61876.1 citrate lyase subunit beta / citryl-CoA lyase [Paraburkholderia hospita]
MTTYPTRTLAALRRTWFFVPGANPAAHTAALRSDADAIVVDLEEMTAPPERPRARELIVALLDGAAGCCALGAVRINRLEHDGLADLEGVMPGRPHAIFLPHTETPEQLAALDAHLGALEQRYGIEHGATEIVPTIESAAGLARLAALLASSPRIRYCMLASEDLAASLGARRTPGGDELLHARSRFLLDTIAAGCHPIDLPCTYRADAVLLRDMERSTQLGFRSKCAVFVEHIDAIHRALTPSSEDALAAQMLLDARRAQQSTGITGAMGWIDAPEANNARRTLERYEAANQAAATSRLAEHKRH